MAILKGGGDPDAEPLLQYVGTGGGNANRANVNANPTNLEQLRGVFPDFAAFSTRYDTAMRGGELQAPNPYANALPNEQEELTTADGGLAEAPRTEQGALQNLEPWALRLFYQLQAALPFVMLQIGGWGGVFNSPGMLSRS